MYVAFSILDHGGNVADLKFTDARASAGEIAAVDAVLGDERGVIQEHERLVRAGTKRRHRMRHLLLPALHALQRESGWISPGGLNHVSDRLQVPPAEAYGVASFYELFKVDEAPDHDGPVHHVCVDGPCRADAEQKIADIEAAGGHVHRSPCLGQCERPTAVFIQGRQGPDVVEADAEPFVRPQASDDGPAPACTVSARSIQSRSTATASMVATPPSPGRLSWDLTQCSQRSATLGCPGAAAQPSRPASSGGPCATPKASASTSLPTATSPSPARSKTARSWRTTPSR